MMWWKFDRDTDEIGITPMEQGAETLDGLTLVEIKTTPQTLHRWFVNEPPPFGDGRVGPFDTLAAAFDYMRSRGYVLNEDVVRERLAAEGE